MVINDGDGVDPTHSITSGLAVQQLIYNTDTTPAHPASPRPTPARSASPRPTLARPGQPHSFLWAPSLASLRYSRVGGSAPPHVGSGSGANATSLA